MFGFRKAGPPLTTFQRVDIELLMRKTIEQSDRLCLDWDVVTDLSQLPLGDSVTEQWIEEASALIADRMGMREVRLRIDVVPGAELGYPSKYHSPSSSSASQQDPAQHATARVSIADDTLSDPLRAFMEIAYQYAHHYWRMTPNPTPLDTDPRTTALLPICCGLGILASDASLYDDQWSQAGWSGWSISRSGYYTAVEIGYALALYARARKEVNPKWGRALRPDSLETARKAWRYFDELARSSRPLLFDSERIPSTNLDMAELATWLGGEDRSFALAAGYALAKREEISDLAVESAMHATYSGDKDLVPVAARLLGRARVSDAKIEARVLELIRSGTPPTSLAAIQSAAAIGLPLKSHRSKITKLLDIFAEDSFALLEVIGTQGSSFTFLAPKICEHVVDAIREMDDPRVLALLTCLQKIVDNPRDTIEGSIRSLEIRTEAIERLEGMRS